MEKEVLVSYDEENDILLLHAADQKSAGSVEIGDFVIDFTHDMAKAVGIEVLNASRVLSEIFRVHIDKSALTNTKKAVLKTVNRGDVIYVYYGIVLQTAQKEMPLHAMIPIPQPVKAV